MPLLPLGLQPEAMAHRHACNLRRGDQQGKSLLVPKYGRWILYLL